MNHRVAEPLRTIELIEPARAEFQDFSVRPLQPAQATNMTQFAESGFVLIGRQASRGIWCHWSDDETGLRFDGLPHVVQPVSPARRPPHCRVDPDASPPPPQHWLAAEESLAKLQICPGGPPVPPTKWEIHLFAQHLFAQHLFARSDSSGGAVNETKATAAVESRRLEITEAVHRLLGYRAVCCFFRKHRSRVAERLRYVAALPP